MRIRPLRTLPRIAGLLVMPLSSIVAQEGRGAAPLTRTAIAEISTASRVTQVVPALNGKRYYYVSQPDTLWLYDVAAKRSTRLATGEMMGLTVSATGDLLAFARMPDGDTGRNIWTIPLDARTGLATGMARRASASKGRSPAISPDGKWIAFAADSGRKTLAVIPSSGGSERDVLTAGGIIGAVQWSGDGKWIYYSSQSPLPTTASPSPGTRPADVLNRVAASGGTPDSLSVIPRFPSGATWSLSADDRQVAYARLSNPTASFADEAESGDMMGSFASVIADRQGTALAVAPILSFERAQWISRSQLLSWFSERRESLNSLSLASGAVHELIADADVQSVPVWNPRRTGFAVAANHRDASIRGMSSILILANADGSARREVSIPSLTWYAGDIAWSPNGEWIALGPQNSTRIVVVNVASGKVQPLTTSGAILSTPPAFRWTADSRRVRYLSGSRPAAGGLRTIRETGLDGLDTLVREIVRGIDVTTRAGASWELAFLSDTAVAYGDTSSTYVQSLTTGKAVRVYDERAGAMGSSPDGSMLAIRHYPPPQQGPHSIDLITTTGTRVSTVSLGVAIGGAVLRKPLFTPDGKRLIVSGRTESGACCSIYDASVHGGPVKKLADFPDGDPRVPLLAPSPDGTTLLFTTSTAWVTNVHAVDVTGVTRNATGKP